MFGYNFTFQSTKAIVTVIVAALMAIGVALGGGNLGDLSTQDWVETAILFLTGSVIVGLLDNVVGFFGGVIKCIVGAAVTGLTAFQVAITNDNIVTQGEWLSVVIGVFVGLSAIYQIPDGPTAEGDVTNPSVVRNP
jgi:hypothetical protein